MLSRAAAAAPGASHPAAPARAVRRVALPAASVRALQDRARVAGRAVNGAGDLYTPNVTESKKDFEAHVHPTALGTGSRVLNAYWSGNITSPWTAMRKQISAGLSFSLSGMPYWTLDSGGFATPARFSTANPTSGDLREWRELNTRWFQLATFLPLMRSHGQAPARRLATSATNTCSALSPVTTYNARARPVYLPKTAGGWNDFWTGAVAVGGQTVQASAPFDAIPVYLRAGSIVPVGPELQYPGSHVRLKRSVAGWGMHENHAVLPELEGPCV